MNQKISIIIPISNEETKHKQLLKQLPTDYEIILSSGHNRANSLNNGAQKANHEFLWFLHADSELSSDCIKKLSENIHHYPDALHFFDLAFDKRTSMMRLNEIGVKIRANIFKIPFGDQGFCISQKNYQLLAGFNESAKYGEDHLFLWSARQNGLKINLIKEKLYTSPRKYQQNGWLRTTIKYQYLWMKQAIPEIIKLILHYKTKTAIAIFVKTPDMSPVKTRLAKDIGQQNATEFYHLCLKNITKTLKKTNLSVYWAVAESEATSHPLWKEFDTIHSGKGGLGNRLHHVYSTLLKKYRNVILIGADCPQIDESQLYEAIAKLNNSNYVIGKSEDGGFFLFASNKAIKKEIWLNTTYSSHKTSDELVQNINEPITYIDNDIDVDDLKSLKIVIDKKDNIDDIKKWYKNLTTTTTSP